MMRKFIILLFSLLILSGIHQETSAETFDHSKFDQILKQYVDQKGLVDYNRISKDSRFNEYMESLKLVKAEELSRNGQLALWLNASFIYVDFDFERTHIDDRADTCTSEAAARRNR